MVSRMLKPLSSLTCFLVVLFGVFCLLLMPATAASADEENTINPRQLPDSSFIYDTGIIDLNTADSYYDDQTVQVVGEVVGDRISADQRGEYYWITLAALDSGSNATVPVYMGAEDAEKIDTFGRYHSSGTVLRVRGTYHLTCSDHEGLSDIHAEFVSVEAAGERHPDTFAIHDYIPGAIAVAIGLFMLVVYYYIRERRR